VNVNNFPVTQPVSGTVSVSNFPATQPVSGTVSISGNVSTIPANASTSTVTLVTTTGSNQTLLSANASRKKAILFFESATDYVKLGTSASTTSYTYKITANNTSLEITGWTGQIDMTGSSGKNVLVTELA
jgi:hypothetical protein